MARARRTAVIEAPSRGVMDGFYAVDLWGSRCWGELCCACLLNGQEGGEVTVSFITRDTSSSENTWRKGFLERYPHEVLVSPRFEAESES